MPVRPVVIRTAGGAHARPVAELARLAMSHPGPVTLATADGTRVDLRSVLAVMDLALLPGDEVTLIADGPGADDLLRALERILAG
ncbi:MULTISPECIES: HPr family phosphocarrier protein [Bacteria]|uniref:HPr family phosphocarrier protein n=1 Tax=Bacteria TaxID=2 RepID=UPI003C79F6FC